MWPWKKRSPVVVGVEADTVTPAALHPTVEETPAQVRTIPTVKFNPKHVTDEVKADIAATLQAEARLASCWQDIYPVAVTSVVDGGNLALLATALRDLGWEKDEAAELARYVHFRATAIMNRARSLALGITEAEWLYSGAPCHPKRPTKQQVRLDTAHKQAKGKRFLVADGLNINGTRTWPGLERHCKCTSRAVLPGFD